MWVDKYIFCLSICLKFRHPIFGFRCFYFNNIIGSGLVLGNVVLGVVSLIDGFLQLVSFEISVFVEIITEIVFWFKGKKNLSMHIIFRLA